MLKLKDGSIHITYFLLVAILKVLIKIHVSILQPSCHLFLHLQISIIYRSTCHMLWIFECHGEE
jgi:hypothetical protein